MTRKQIREMTVTSEMKDALAEVAEAQENFWNALGELENQIGLSLNGNCDFLHYTDPSDEDVREVAEQYTTDDLEEDGDAEE